MITRRKLWSVMAGVASAVGLPSAAKAMPVESGCGPMQVMGLAEIRWRFSATPGSEKYGIAPLPPQGAPGLMTIQDMTAWVNAMPNVYWTNYSSPETYEYGYGVRCNDNPSEIALATDLLLRMMQHTIVSFRSGAGGDKMPFIWRDPPEIDTWRGEIIEYRSDGPDFDITTDQRCVKDMSKVYVKVYARFAVDKEPSGTVVTRDEADGIPQGWELVERIPASRPFADPSRLAIRIRKT